MITGINSEDRLVQKTVADHLNQKLGWDSIYAYNEETFGPSGTLGRTNDREIVLVRDLRAAIIRLNPGLPENAIESAISILTSYDFSRTLLQQNQNFYKCIRDGVPVEYRDGQNILRQAHVRVIDFQNGRAADGTPNNRFLAVRELKIQGIRVPYYNRRADLVCFVNGLPLVFIELKAVYRNIRRGFDDNLTDYMTEQVISHAFYHNVFLIVSNGDKAKYGSITSKWEHFVEWKRNDENDKGRVDAETLFDGMLQQERLLDLVENFILYDDSKPGGMRKIVARNHQWLGVNRAVESVKKQEELKKLYPERERLRYAIPKQLPEPSLEVIESRSASEIKDSETLQKIKLPLVERAHPDLGRLGVFWHTQGSGKSYSMAFFTEKVRRVIPGSHTFVLMTDRDDLDDQIFRTFRGIGIITDQTPRASSGKELEKILTENHRYIFTLIQKFRRNEIPKKPYSLRDDIIVISDEAHRTQGGKLARNMRLALPNASFIGFTGTPLFKYDQITRRIFGNYVSRYDFRRSEEDGSTVRLIYESRGEKLGIAHIDLNDRIARKIEESNLDQDQLTKLEKLVGKDYEIITADDRLDKLADDFVEHCSGRWESGKSMLVCIDKLTCGRVYQRIIPRWQNTISALKQDLSSLEQLPDQIGSEERERRNDAIANLRSKIQWMESTDIAIIISEAQNEVRDFSRWGIDIVPHRHLIKQGFETPDGERVDVETAFKDPVHPFRIAVVCAMWLTGFDVECLSTLYIDKPMKAHTLMQAIARANRVYPNKDCGVIVDYNGVLPSLREALAEYAVGDNDDIDKPEDIIRPIDDFLLSLQDAISQTEGYLQILGFDPTRLIGSHGFDRIQALRDAVNVIYTSDETRRRYEIFARIVFSRFKALITEPSVYQFAERHDNIEAIYKKLEENRDLSDVTDVLKEIHRIVNEAIQTQENPEGPTEHVIIDLSNIDFDKLREEFATKVQRKNIAIQDIRTVVERRLQLMLANNPQRMDYYKKYQEIIADYNREKDRSTIEDTFARLVMLIKELDAEQQRAVKEGLSEDELALFDLINKDRISKNERERVKQASRTLLNSLQELLATMELWTKNPQTQAQVEVFILNKLFETLPRPPFTEDECSGAAHRIYEFVWQRYSDNMGLA